MTILGELVVCMFVCCQGMPDGAVVYESALVYMYIRSGSNEQSSVFGVLFRSIFQTCHSNH